jgi:hypothetical protein
LCCNVPPEEETLRYSATLPSSLRCAATQLHKSKKEERCLPGSCVGPPPTLAIAPLLQQLQAPTPTTPAPAPSSLLFDISGALAME